MPYLLHCTLMNDNELYEWNTLCNKYKYIIWKTYDDNKEYKISFRSVIERNLFETELKTKLPYINCIHSFTKIF
jgi:hypothetical protein